MIHFRIMSVGVADIINLEGQQGPALGVGQGHVRDGGGADARASQEEGQPQSMLSTSDYQ